MKISFCITSCNRRWQLEQTLAHNLRLAGPAVEFTLVDYGSTDGLADWVWAQFGDQIADGRLRFYEVASRVSWHAAKAKNLAHRISTGDYLFNLDADNFVTSRDIESVASAARRDCGVQQFSGNRKDGTFGRVGLARDLFYQLGGYDESLLPMGTQDFDLLLRMRASGMDIDSSGAPELPAVQNDVAQKVAAISDKISRPAELYLTMLRLNRLRSYLRIRLHGPQLVGGFASYRGRLNGEPKAIFGLPDEE